ncbi:hypothetical protein D9758_018240 [Tetrapyrgos nigripes]|uniref:Uncharacterized protein n=1 Tax=Tetrapyrgos nigripes TaxID=182062 RepID=A0A8H5C416_9AGAR|nr:hypothetical protein D9758_018240 [Tetrapyrgos nigripes]
MSLALIKGRRCGEGIRTRTGKLNLIRFSSLKTGLYATRLQNHYLLLPRLDLRADCLWTPETLDIKSLSLKALNLEARQLQGGGDDSGSSSDGSESSSVPDLTIPNKCDDQCSDWQVCFGVDECCTDSMGSSLVVCLNCIVANKGGSEADAQSFYDSQYFQGCEDAGANVKERTVSAAIGLHGTRQWQSVMAIAVAVAVLLVV